MHKATKLLVESRVSREVCFVKWHACTDRYQCAFQTLFFFFFLVCHSKSCICSVFQLLVNSK